MEVADIMSSPAQTIHRGASIREAARLMTEANVGALPVCDGNQLLGMITDRDVLVRCVAAGRSPDRVTVGEVMTSAPIGVGPHESIGRAAFLLGRHRIRRLPVMEGGSVLGVISADDVARHFSDQAFVGEMARQVAHQSGPLREAA